MEIPCKICTDSDDASTLVMAIKKKKPRTQHSPRGVSDKFSCHGTDWNPLNRKLLRRMCQSADKDINARTLGDVAESLGRRENAVAVHAARGLNVQSGNEPSLRGRSRTTPAARKMITHQELRNPCTLLPLGQYSNPSKTSALSSGK